MSDEQEKSTGVGAAFFLGGVLGWLARGLGRPSHPVTLTASPQEIASPPTRHGQSTPKNTESVRDCGCAERGRGADRSLDPVGTNLIRRERSGAVLVVLLFVAAMGGSIGFLVTYWTGGSNQMLGGTLALFFGGLGAAAVVWAHNLTANKEAVGPRERGDAAEAHNAAAETFAEGARDIQRRRLLAWMSAGGAGLFGVMVISAFRSLGLSPDTSLYTAVWKRGQRLMTVDGQPVRADALTPGSTTIVFPEDSVGSEKAQTVLLRVDPDLLRLPRQRVGWAPMGNLAYSRVCTHAGCSVGMYETTSHQLMCPCHQSTFDVLNGAEPTGGPAARPLPQLPLYADSDGILRAAGGFSEPPGPGFWGMPS
jgi:ubiquinol-cytochrome c reductase iron-sulfur subunit